MVNFNKKFKGTNMKNLTELNLSNKKYTTKTSHTTESRSKTTYNKYTQQGTPDKKEKIEKDVDINNENFVSLLVKFPLNTFNTSNRDYRYSTFNDVYNVAEEGTFEYDYDYGYS